MKLKQITTSSLVKSIGHTFRLIRTYHRESADAVAYSLGYKYPSSYCKVERGEIHELCIEKLIKFCQHFNITFMSFMLVVEKIDGPNSCIMDLECYSIISGNEKQLIDELIMLDSKIDHSSE